MTRIRLLVVEDDPDGQEVLQSLLEHYRIDADVVSNGEEALELLTRDGTYGAAIIDLALPGMDGFTLLHQVQRARALPCIAVTAFHSAELAVKAIDAGFSAYFPKPIDTGTFVQELQRVLP